MLSKLLKSKPNDYRESESVLEELRTAFVVMLTEKLGWMVERGTLEDWGSSAREFAVKFRGKWYRVRFDIEEHDKFDWW